MAGLEPSAQQFVSLTVEGTIDSFTILPFWSDLNNPDASFLPFEFNYESGFSNFTLLTSPELRTFKLDWKLKAITFSVTSDMGEFWYFMDYTHDHPSADLVFGYELKSVDYTPTSVPEGGSSVLLLGLGLLGVFYAHRRNIFHAVSK